MFSSAARLSPRCRSTQTVSDGILGNVPLSRCMSVRRESMSQSLHPEEFLERFGLAEFRLGQRDVIAAVLEGADCLCIMPTGGGKSLCYQLPSIARDGVTLVVSPLIALMKDQVDTLQARGIRADFINSSLSTSDQAARLTRLSDGQYDLLYVAPERFRSPRFLEALKKTPLQLLAIDEAHCISEWGHDFRHDYARLGEYRRRLGNPQTIALTATATSDVRDDVVCQLDLESPRIFVAGFARDNLHYTVQTHHSKQDKQRALLDFLSDTPGSGIIYASTRKGCEEVKEFVTENSRRSAAVYHGGMMPDDRRRIQEQFMQGKVEMVAATNAFGMGIDKADVRFVAHFNIPGSLEAYYQEAGRAGRDGLPSKCLLLHSPKDRFIQEFFIDSAHPPREVIAQVYEYLRLHPNDPIELTQQELKEQLGLSISTEGVGTCERLLEKCDVLERLEPNRNMAAARIETDAPSLAELLPSQAQVRRRVAGALESLIGPRRYELVYFHPRELAELSGLELSSVTRALRELTKLDGIDYVPPFRGRAVHMLRRDLSFHQLDIDYQELEQRREASLQKLDRVIRFAQTRGCRQLEILRYFGETTDRACGHCDNCDSRSPAAKQSGSKPAVDVAVVPDALREVARMVLSGVARTNGRFGKQLVAAMLCGSKSAKVLRWKLDQLSTFGLLDDFTQPEVTQIIDALIEVGMVEQSEVDRFRPTIRITELGTKVMRGDQPLGGHLSIASSIEQKIAIKYARWQKTARSAPADRADAVDATRTSIGAPQPPKIARGGKGDDIAIRPNHYWTWRLLHDGYTAEQCASIRQVSPQVVCDHLVQAAENGLDVQLSWLLSSIQIEWLDQQLPSGTSRPERSLLSNLPGDLRPEHVELFLKCRSQRLVADKSNA